jgi:crossover junction endodeoxyribonuclease RusA
VIELELPYPPSVNHYWRRVGARTLISRGGRAFRQAVCSILAARGVRPLDGPLEMEIDVYPPDHRRRDLDNLQKGLLDALAHGGAYHDDSQIARFTVERKPVVPEGKVVVRLEAYRNERTAATHRSPAALHVRPD